MTASSENDTPRHDILDKADEIIARNNTEKATLVRHGRRMEWLRMLLQVLQSAATIIAIVLVLAHFHSETQQQLAEAKNAPQAIVQIEDQVVCPLAKAIASHINTPERAAIIRQYCPMTKH